MVLQRRLHAAAHRSRPPPPWQCLKLQALYSLSALHIATTSPCRGQHTHADRTAEKGSDTVVPVFVWQTCWPAGTLQPWQTT